MESRRRTCLHPGGFQTKPGIPFGALCRTKPLNRTEPKRLRAHLKPGTCTTPNHELLPPHLSLFFLSRQRHSHHFIRLCRHATLPSMCNSLSSRASKRAHTKDKNKERQPEVSPLHRLSVQPPERGHGEHEEEGYAGLPGAACFFDGGV